MKNFEQFFSEMALSDMQKFGKWDDKKNRHGYDKQSIGILNSDPGWKKIQDKFNKINLADFNLYFIKNKNVWKTSEVGKVPDTNYILDKFGVDITDSPDYNKDSITMVFTNNAAAEKVPLTYWTIAHRIGHGFSASYRYDRGGSNEYNLKYAGTALRKLMRNCYGVDDVDLYSNTYEKRNLFETIGTFRSARMNKLNRPFEFIYECFAQYLFSNGNLTFNPMPPELKSSNKKAWGNETGFSRRLKVSQDEAEDYLMEFKYALESIFYFWINDHIGTVSVM